MESERDGLSERARRRAAELARESDVRPRREPPVGEGLTEPKGTIRVLPFAPVRSPAAPLPGTVLMREYRGQQIRVRVLDEGYEYGGRVFRSLTAVATAVTGAHWNGRAFFGLGAPAKPAGGR